jgi:hypothetical protein
MSIHATLENKCEDSKSIPFADMEIKFILLEEHHAPSGSSHHENANIAALNPNPLATLNRHNGKFKPKGGNKPEITRRLDVPKVIAMAGPSSPSVATNPGIETLNVLQVR